MNNIDNEKKEEEEEENRMKKKEFLHFGKENLCSKEETLSSVGFSLLFFFLGIFLDDRECLEKSFSSLVFDQQTKKNEIVSGKSVSPIDGGNNKCLIC